MYDMNSRLEDGYITFAPRGITTTDYGYLAASGYWSAQIYLKEGGMPFILQEFLRVPEGCVLEVYPVGNHSLDDAAKFINYRVADIYQYVVDRCSKELRLPKFDLAKHQLGPIPGSPPSNSLGSVLKGGLRQVG